MNKDTYQKSQKTQKISLILDEMRELGKFRGIMLSYRNGGLIAQNIGNNTDFNEFAAMCASVLESAEGLGKSFGAMKLGKIIAELGNYTIIIIECNNDIFLTFILNNDSQIELVFKNLAEFSQKIIEAI